MKRIGNLYQQVYGLENLKLADIKAGKGKSAQYGVKLHNKNREANLFALHLMLKNKTYKTSPYTTFKIYEPKEREVFRLPYFPDLMYCLKLDVRKFYPSINHYVLKKMLRRKFKDADLLWLLDEIIDSAPGLPIGNYLSQYFANFYLAYFDHWIKEEKRVKYYFRYADDMVILSDDKSYLHDLLKEIGKYFNEELKLEIKSNYQIFPVDSRSIDFVGY